MQTHLLHFNRQSSPDYPTLRRSASVTFARPILGLICRDDQLDATDASLGNPKVAYPHGGSRAFNSSTAGSASTCDVVMVAEDHRTLLVDFALVKGLCQVRVLVEPPKADQDRAKAVHGKPKAVPDRSARLP
jgi:hypothetical protein